VRGEGDRGHPRDARAYGQLGEEPPEERARQGEEDDVRRVVGDRPPAAGRASPLRVEDVRSGDQRSVVRVRRVDDVQVGPAECAPEARRVRQEGGLVDEEIAVVEVGKAEGQRARVKREGCDRGQPYGTSGSAQQRKPVE
jgi:hypothetical protein